MSKAKTYIITDPCYILPDAVWSECIKKAGENNKDWGDRFNEQVQTALSAFVGSKAWANSTLFGDWTNVMYGPNVIQDRFCADSGMVSVCEYNDKVKEATKDLPEHCFAIIEADNNIKVSFDESISDWCVVEIESSFGNFHSEYPAQEDEEW